MPSEFKPVLFATLGTALLTRSDPAAESLRPLTLKALLDWNCRIPLWSRLAEMPSTLSWAFSSSTCPWTESPVLPGNRERMRPRGGVHCEGVGRRRRSREAAAAPMVTAGVVSTLVRESQPRGTYGTGAQVDARRGVRAGTLPAADKNLQVGGVRFVIVAEARRYRPAGRFHAIGLDTHYSAWRGSGKGVSSSIRWPTFASSRASGKYCSGRHPRSATG